MTIVDNVSGLLETIWSPWMCKAALLFLTAVSVHISLSPPNPPVKSEECCSGTEGTNTIFEKFVQSVTWCSKCMVWIGMACDMALVAVDQIVTHHFNKSWGTDGLVHPAWSDPVHPWMVAGAICTIIAACLRVWCFKTLGPFFTFEITIRPKHELIKHGPYAWVRHPSYTGIYMTLIGATLVLGAPGTWVADCGVGTWLGALVACFWFLKCVFAFRGMCVRYKAEDEILRQTFGVEWEEYASRVPCKFIPGVI